MNILDIIKNRRSVREFTDQEIPDETVGALIEAIRWAPSAGNLQSRKFYFVFNKEIKKRLVKAALGQDFIAQAPLAIVACLNRAISVRYGDLGVHLYSIQDVAASIENMMLVVHEQGLGSCWVGAFNEFDVAEVMDLPDNLRPVAIVPIGYPSMIPNTPPRISPAEAVEIVR